MFKRIALLLLFLWATPAYAQLNLTYTSFQPGQTISAAQFTTNFTTISANALNRTNGTMTGAFVANGTVDINSTFTIGSGNVQPFDSTGKIQAISSTYFASLSGANLTGVVVTEANVTDGTIFPRLGATETITGAWTFSTAPTLAGTNVSAIPEANITDGTLLARLGANETVTGTWTFNNTINGAVVNGITTGNYNSYSPTLTGGGASGTWGINVTGNAATATNGLTTGNYNSYAPTLTGTGASGNWGINISGNAATATSVVGTSITGAQLAVGITASSLTTFGTVSGLTLANGTDSAPTLRFSSNSNAGMYYNSSNPTIEFGSNFSDAANRGVVRSVAGASGGRVDVLVAATFAAVFQPGGVTTIHINPAATNTYDLGAGVAAWRHIYSYAYTTVSDARLKKDITDTTLGIEFIDALRPKEYRFIKNSEVKRYGFIAQDLQKLGFEGVSVGDTGVLGLRYTELIAPMVKGLQEVHAEVHALASLAVAQQKMIAELTLRIEALEKGRVAE